MLNRPDIATRATPRTGRGAGPDFICVGAQKAGTRWLYDQLAFHPAFWMPPVKELHYFDGARPGFPQGPAPPGADRQGPRQGQPRPDGRRRQPLRGPRPPLRRAEYLRLFKDKKAGIEGYARLFDEKGEDMTGDVTPAYSKLGDDDARAIVQRFPEVQIVFIAARADRAAVVGARHGGTPGEEP